MKKFQVNTHRIDPYKNFKFTVVWDNQVVAGVSKVGALKRTTEIVTHNEGNLAVASLSPAHTKFDAIQLERGITYATEFRDWANMVHSPLGDAGMSLRNMRKNIRINLNDINGITVQSYLIHRCWVSEYVALPELDANANAVAFEHIVLQNEGFEYDENIRELMET